MIKLPTELSLDNVWVRVNSDALSANARALLSYLGADQSSSPKLMAVVKANGYGHGAAMAAKAFRDGGATWFGVTTLSEALELVESGIDSHKTPILVFAPLISRLQCETAIRSGIHVTACDLGHVDLLSRSAEELDAKAEVHLKLDTGMSRLGLPSSEAFKAAMALQLNNNLNLTGVYTHFATASESSLATKYKQLAAYSGFCDSLRNAGVDGFIRHCSNSSALLRLPEARMDLVRAGTTLYGQYPSAQCPRVPGLISDTIALEARVVFVHDLPSGAAVGYGAEYVTRRPTRAAVLPVGFYDGVSMRPASVSCGLRGLKQMVSTVFKPQPLSVRFYGSVAPVIGRVAMQMIVVDVTGASTPIQEGDIAVVPARRLAINASLPRVLCEPEGAT